VTFDRIGDHNPSLDAISPRALPDETHRLRHPLMKLAFGALASDRVDVDIAGDSKQPGDAIAGPVPFGQGAVGADEGLLSQLAGLGRRPCPRQQIAHHRLLSRLH
jgi:hypothetical protein